MSDTYTWPQRCPDLVQDVSLKRARIDDENNTSAIRTTISGVDEEHPLPVSINAVPGVDNDHPLPVLVKSDKTQWFLRGYVSDSEIHYHRVQWFYVSPQPLLININYGNTRWVTITKRSSIDDYAGTNAPDLTNPPVYRFDSAYNDNVFPGGWIAGYSDTYLGNLALLGFKAGNTDFSSPDIEVSQGSKFFWNGDDFMDCQQQFDSATLYLQKVGGTQGDAAWSGSGNGTVISLLKGIANIF